MNFLCIIIVIVIIISSSIIYLHLYLLLKAALILAFDSREMIAIVVNFLLFIYQLPH